MCVDAGKRGVRRQRSGVRPVADLSALSEAIGGIT
jgi:hypothetical protein